MQYRRKYNSKYKHETRPWKHLFNFRYELSNADWQVFEFKIYGVVYTSPSLKFKEAYNKARMWEKLSDS